MKAIYHLKLCHPIMNPWYSNAKILNRLDIFFSNEVHPKLRIGLSSFSTCWDIFSKIQPKQCCMYIFFVGCFPTGWHHSFLCSNMRNWKLLDCFDNCCHISGNLASSAELYSTIYSHVFFFFHVFFTFPRCLHFSLFVPPWSRQTGPYLVMVASVWLVDALLWIQ